MAAVFKKFNKLPYASSNCLDNGGMFVPNGSSDPTTVRGSFFTVTHVSTGVWRVTLSYPVQHFESIVVTGQFATADTDTHLFRVGDVSTSGHYFEVVHMSSSATNTTTPVAADITASGTARRINFRVVTIASAVPGSGK